MAIKFPINPNIDDEYSHANKTWVFNGVSWDLRTNVINNPLSEKGDILIYSFENVRLPIGVRGQVLAVDQDAPTGMKWTTLPGGGVALLASLSPAAASTLDFSTVFSSVYDSYIISGTDIRPSAKDTLHLRFFVDGVIDAGTYYGTSTGTATFAAANKSFGLSTNVITEGAGLNFNVEVRNTNSITGLKTIHSSAEMQTTTTPTFSILRQGGIYRAANRISGFRLFWASGSDFISQGRVRIYGLVT